MQIKAADRQLDLLGSGPAVHAHGKFDKNWLDWQLCDSFDPSRSLPKVTVEWILQHVRDLVLHTSLNHLSTEGIEGVCGIYLGHAGTREGW